MARLEKQEQADTVKLLTLLGAAVYVLGTRRPRGRRCPSCGTLVLEHQGTCQTPGLPDLIAFLPGPAAGGARPVLFIEQKAVSGRLSAPQGDFRDVVQGSGAHYVSGTLDDVLAWLTARGYVRGSGWAERSHWEGADR